ncbi:hypothetical protein BV133_3220 [Blastochloris viridis]|uniref:Uncharacterized protein n=1 Tax=Blastochloris viridis TaxID=1079 RepID=A0A182D6N2_BLAVI|nr:hypothetical protein BV133_3220 [Blastochloris viridis]
MARGIEVSRPHGEEAAQQPSRTMWPWPPHPSRREPPDFPVSRSSGRGPQTSVKVQTQ